MVLLFNLLKFHKNGGGGDEVLGFWFHNNDLLKLNKNNWRSWNSTSIYFMSGMIGWRPPHLPWSFPKDRHHQACLKKMSNEAEGETKEARSPCGHGGCWENHRKCRDLPAMFDCEWLWDYGKGFSAFWSTFDAQPFLCEDGRFGEFLFLSHCF